MLAAAALRCIGGQMQSRLIIDSEELRERAAARWASRIRSKKYEIEDMVNGDCLFAATGVTDGLAAVAASEFRKDVIETETVVMRSVTGTVRRIKAEHRQARQVRPGLSQPRGRAHERRERCSASCSYRQGTDDDHDLAMPPHCRSKRLTAFPRRDRIRRPARLWRDRLDPRGAARALAIAQRHRLPEMLARVLAGRGVEVDAVEDFLDPTIRRLMPDPFTR